MSAKATIAFFGATGGCTLNALALALSNGHKTVACQYVDGVTDVRTPAKLQKLLTEAPHSISQDILDSQLHVVAGNIDDVAAIKTVFDQNPSVIISGVGGAPKFQASLFHPVTLDQPNICTDAANNVIKALKELDAEKQLATKPFLIVIGTTGMSHTRDVPYLFMPLYHVVLEAPHADKGRMEQIVIEAAKDSPSVLSGYSLVRPSLLVDGPALGLDQVRSGWENHKLDPRETGPGPAIGYTIRRADVGLWIYEHYINNKADEWNARCVSITY